MGFLLLVASSNWMFPLFEMDERAIRTVVMKARAEDMIAAGVMEERERAVIFKEPDNLEYDWGRMVDRMTAMKPDCPQLYCENWLPPLRDIYENKWMTMRFIEYLKSIIPFYGPIQQEELKLVLVDALWREKVLSLMVDIRATYYTWEGKRLLLQQLRDELGVAWYLGLWPDPLPDLAYNIGWEWPPPESN